VLDRAENVRTLLIVLGVSTAVWLLWAGVMGAPVWFIVVLAVAWVAGFASGRTDRLTVFLLCLPLCWAWGVAWSTWITSESQCFVGPGADGQHWWPPYVDCENGNTLPGDVEVGPWVFFGPFLAGVIAAALLAVRGNPVWRIAAATVVTLLGVLAVFS
jgi:hypothetical protein